MAKADIQLLFGVLGEGSLSGESGRLIKDQLDQILSSLNEKPFKIKVELDAESTKKKDWTTQLQKKLDAMSSNNRLSVTVSNLKLGANAIRDFKNQLSAVIHTLDLDRDVSLTFTAKDIGDITTEFRSASDAADAAAREAGLFKVQVEALGGMKKTLQSALSSLSANASDDEKTRIAEITKQYEQWAEKIETVRAGKSSIEDSYKQGLEAEGSAIRANIDAINDMRRASVEAEAAREAASRQRAEAEKAAQAEARAAQREAEKARGTAVERNSLYEQVEKAIGRISRAQKIWTASREGVTSEEYGKLDKYIEALKELEHEIEHPENSDNPIGKEAIKTRLSEVNAAFAKTSGVIKAANEDKLSFFQHVGSLADKFSSWLTISQVVMKIYDALRKMVVAVMEVDTAMTELRKVTDETEEVYARFLETSVTRAKQLGATVADTVSASADFARLGYTLTEAASLADAAIVYKNVGDGIRDIGMASESIISTMKAFGISAKDAMLIVDKFNETGNNFAISSKGVGDALLRSASALAAGNNTLDESIALITAANSSVQDADVVGTTMKTLSMYLRAAKTEAEAAGESTEGMANSISELRSEILTLTDNRVDIQIDENTFKSTYQIMKELSDIWGELTDITRANILEQIAGKRNANVISSLLENFDIAEEVMEDAANAAGSALAENEKYLESINGHIAEIKAAFEELSVSVIDTGVVKSIIDLGTAFLNVLNIVAQVINVFGGLNTVLAGIALSPLIQWLVKLHKEMKLLAEMQEAAATASAGAAAVYGTSTTRLGRLAAAFKAVGVSAVSTKVAVMGVAAALVLIPQIVNACVEAYKRKHKSIEELNNEYSSLRSEINSISSEYRDIKSAAESIIPRFTELARGVDKFGQKARLTDEEYAEFLELNNKIADMFPEINMGMDSSGNAMIALSYSADTLTESLHELVEAQRLAANEKIAESMKEAVDNTFDLAGSYEKERNDLINRKKELEKFYKYLLSGGAPIIPTAATSASEIDTNRKREELYDMLDVRTEYSTEDRVLKYVFDEDSIEESFKLANELIDRQINMTEKNISAAHKRLSPVVSAWLQTDLSFQGLDDTMKSIAETMVGGLDFRALGLDTEEKIKDYVDEYIVSPLRMAAADLPDVSAAFSNITKWQTDLKNGEMSYDEFAKGITDAFNTMLSAMSPDVVDEFKKHFVDGFSEMGIEGAAFEEVLENLIAELGRTEQAVQSVTALDDTAGKFGGIIDVLKSASDEFTNFGSVSADTYRRVTALGEDYAGLFDFSSGKIKLQNKALGELVDGLIQEYGAMLAANGATEDQIEALYLYGAGLASANLKTDVTVSSMKSYIDILSQVKDGTSYSTIAMLELVEQYPELTDAVIKTAKGYSIEEDAVKSLIAEKAKEIKINESLIRSQARLNLVKRANNESTANTVDAIFEEYGDSISSFEDYVGAWERYFDRSAGGVSWVDGLEEYVDATIAETKRLEGVNALLEDLLSPDQYKFGGGSEDSGGGSGGSESTETEFDRQYKEHQHLLAMERESMEDYLRWLGSAYQAAYSSGLIKLDDYYKYQEEVYDKTKELFSSRLGDAEHSIFLLEKSEADADEIVKIYSGMLSAIDGQIEAYTALGLGKNSDYIKELQKQWWSYRDDIIGVYESSLDSRISGFEHDIFLLEKSKSDSDEIASIYRKMQEAVHSTAEKYRSLGLSENDDYITALQKQWWEYEDSIAQLRRDTFDKYLSDSKFSIEQLKLDGADASEISRSYSAVLRAIDDEIEYYLSGGSDATDEVVQNLIDEAHSLRDEVVSSLSDIVSDAQSAVDDLQNVYKTLGDAADEYAEYGYITIDSLQDIIGLGVEYMAFLQDENGQLVINKDSIQKVIAARAEQLAVESALNYVEQLRLALSDGNTTELERLLHATANATGATWELVYANLALLDLDNGQYEAALSNINNMRSLADNAIANIGMSMSGEAQSRSEMLREELEARKEALNEQKDALDDILDYTMELVKWEAEQQVKALEDQISDYEKIVELKKEMLEATRDEADYEDGLSDKIAEIAKLQERINALSLDDSRDAQAEKISLEEELSELQKELTDYQADHMLEAHENTLDDMADAYSSEKEREIAAVEETVSSTEKVYRLAIDRIDNDWAGLYQDLLTYNYEYGNTLENDLVSAWNAASAAVLEYGSYVQAVSGITAAINEAESTEITEPSGTNVIGTSGSYRDDAQKSVSSRSDYNAEAESARRKVQQISGLVDRMKANSAAWWESSGSDRTRLEKDNADIAARLEALLGKRLIRGADGVWYIGSVGGGNKLYDRYHEGGIVGGGTKTALTPLEKNEAFAVLQRGEMVLTDGQQTELFRLIEFATTLSKRFGELIENTGYGRLPQNKLVASPEDLAPITEDKRVNIEFGDVYITGANNETVERHREINRQFTNEVLRQLNIKR